MLAVAAFFLNGFDSNYPEGVDTDAYELRSVTEGDGRYDVITIEGERFILEPGNVEVYALEDSTRDFLSRDQRTMWLQESSVERLGLDASELSQVG